MHTKIDDIAVIKRAKDKTYPKDTIYLALSATDQKVHISDSPINLSSRYCLIIPKVEINVIYLYYAMKKYEDYFFNAFALASDFLPNLPLMFLNPQPCMKSHTAFFVSFP